MGSAKINKTCESCDAKCCKYVVVGINVPEKIEDFEIIKWFVSHKNVNVFVDDSYEWYLEFLTPCEFLNKENQCTNYENRYKICREYKFDECTFHNDYEEKFTFEQLEDVEKYIREVYNKGKHIIPDEDSS
jgi:Fe-S-cluster containining protein